MKRFVIAAALAIALMGISSTAFAASISVDKPFQFTFANTFLNEQKNAKPKDRDATADGFIITATGGLLGVAYERYEATAEGTTQGPSGTFDIRMKFQFYDLLLDLPLPVVNLAIGYGVGTVNTQLTNGSSLPTIAEADATQTFVRLGIPFGKVFDLHLGYHVIQSEGGKFTGGGGNDKFIVKGRMLSAGVRAGW